MSEKPLEFSEVKKYENGVTYSWVNKDVYDLAVRRIVSLDYQVQELLVENAKLKEKLDLLTKEK